MMLNIFSHACGLLIYLLQKNVYLDHVPTFKLNCLPFSLFNYVCTHLIYTFRILDPCQIHDLHIFSPIMWVVFSLS